MAPDDFVMAMHLTLQSLYLSTIHPFFPMKFILILSMITSTVNNEPEEARDDHKSESMESLSVKKTRR
jgi:hypothetical protein